jgi:hypothetical protein
MEYNFPSGGHDPMDWNVPANFETIYAQLAPDAVQYAVEHICTMNGLRPTPGLIERLEREEELNAGRGPARRSTLILVVSGVHARLVMC